MLVGNSFYRLLFQKKKKKKKKKKKMQVLKTLYSCNTNSSFRSEINSIFIKIVLIIKTNTIDLQRSTCVFFVSGIEN